MEDAIFSEYDDFIQAIESGKLDEDRIINFMEISNYEDEYGHNEIDGSTTAFENLVRRYLHSNFSGQYGMHSDFCVHIYTKEFHKEKELHKMYIVY